MSDSSPRLGLPDLPDTPELYADTVADAFARIDAFTDLYLKGQFVNTPPASPADGDSYLIGGSPTGDWSDYAYKVAVCRDGAWTKLAPFNGLRAYVATTGSFIVYVDGAWLDWDAMIGAAEGSIASAATCDIGAAGSLFAAVTGTTAITSFGTAASKLRFLRFAGALTLTHNGTSLILPGGANIVAAAGDTACFTSDAGGNWCCRSYSRASGQPVATALSVASVAASGVIGGGGLSWGGAVVGSFTGHAVMSGKSGTQGCILQFQGPAGEDWAHIRLSQSGGVLTGLNITTRINEPININPNETQTIAVNAGNVGIGTTASGGWFGNAKLSVQDASLGWAIGAYRSAASGAAVNCRVDNTNSNLVEFNYNGTNVGAITTSGSATAYNTTSDARLKRVSQQQADYRGAIRALWVGDFTWKQTGAAGFGVLAQQAWETMPHHQGVTPPVDESGDWHASAEPFAHLALWGVKDLYTLVEALAARIAVLEAAHDAG